MRSHHDLGGRPAGPIDRSEHEYTPWEKRIDAIFALLVHEKNVMRVDELRRGIEALGPVAYHSLSYYERWIASITTILLEKGVLGEAEINARIGEIKARGGAQQQP